LSTSFAETPISFESFLPSVGQDLSQLSVDNLETSLAAVSVANESKSKRQVEDDHAGVGGAAATDVDIVVRLEDSEKNQGSFCNQFLKIYFTL
jgi:hypothetical protein